MKQQNILSLVLPLAALMFGACGDDSSSATDASVSSNGHDSSSNFVKESFEDLPVCVDNLEGVLAYVKDEKTEYACADGEWVANDEKEQESSSDNKVVESSSSSTDEESGDSSSSQKKKC